MYQVTYLDLFYVKSGDQRMNLLLNISHELNNHHKLNQLLSCTYCKNRYLKNENCIYDRIPEIDVDLCVTWRPIYELIY